MFLKINKIEKPLARLRKKTIQTKLEMKEDITMDTAEINRIMKLLWHLHANEFGNLEEMENV